MAFIRKVYNGAKAPEPELMAHDCALVAGRPALHLALVGFKDEKGKQVAGCKLSLWHESGNIKLCINDPVAGEMAFALLDPFMGLAEAINDVLDQGGLEWRKDPKKR